MLKVHYFDLSICDDIKSTTSLQNPEQIEANKVWAKSSEILEITHTHPFNGPLPGLPRWAGTRKVKPTWILLKQETVSGSDISLATCKSAPRSRQITTPAPHHSKFFYRPDALPAAQPTASKQWKTGDKTSGNKVRDRLGTPETSLSGRRTRTARSVRRSKFVVAPPVGNIVMNLRRRMTSHSRRRRQRRYT